MRRRALHGLDGKHGKQAAPRDNKQYRSRERGGSGEERMKGVRVRRRKEKRSNDGRLELLRRIRRWLGYVLWGAQFKLKYSVAQGRAS